MSPSNYDYPTLELRGYSISEMARLYQISGKTFKKWIKPFANEIGLRHGRFYNINQVKTILDRLGTPEGLLQQNVPIQPNTEKNGTTCPKLS